MTRYFLIPVLTITLTFTALAQDAAKDQPENEPALKAEDLKLVEEQMQQDVVLRALVDELQRNKDGLKLEDLQRPYFIEYALIDMAGAYASADLGALTRSTESRSRNLRTEIRVGSYQLDNTNFGGGSGGYYGGGADIPLEDDYNAIRQAIWWATDRDYKDVIESYEGKLAFMKTKMIEDKPDDFSHEEPTIFFEERLTPAAELKAFESLAIELSKVFRDYPDVQDSGVSVGGGGGNRYLVNTEGTRMRTHGLWYTLQVGAQVQADDGMKMSDSFTLYHRKLEDFPPLPDLVARLRHMAEQLIAVRNAPKLDSYAGPVLIEAEPAAQVFTQRFGNRFNGGQRNVGSGTDPDDFENKLEKRVLPRFLNVVDDPTQKTIEGVPIMGHYEYDDQGVKVAPLTLVEKGRLKALVMSRNPSRKFKNSNGHGRGVYQPSASIGTLIVTSTEPQTAEDLKQQLLEACEEEDLEFGIRIASFGGGGGGMPLLMYKVFPDGKEELVRAAEIARFDLKAFKRMIAAGDEPHVLNMGSMQGRTVVAPAMLFEELDLAKIDRDFDKPPLLPNPLVRNKGKPTEDPKE